MWTISHAYCRILCALKVFFIDRYLIFYALSWIIIRFSRQSGSPLPYLNNWLTDFVFIPLIAHAAFCFGVFLLGIKSYKFPLSQLLVLAFVVSLFFEVLSPRITDYNTSDWVDVLCYFSGALFYFYIHQPYNNKKFITERTGLPAATGTTTSG